VELNRRIPRSLTLVASCDCSARLLSYCLVLRIVWVELVEERVTPAPPHLEPIVPNSGNRVIRLIEDLIDVAALFEVILLSGPVALYLTLVLHVFTVELQSIASQSPCIELVEERVTPAPPHLEPIVPNSGNRLKTKPFTSPQSVS
jgi:hypothetical protein